MRRRSTSRTAIKCMLAEWQRVAVAVARSQCVWKVYFHSWRRNHTRGDTCARESEWTRLCECVYRKNDSFKLLTINEALHTTHFHVSLNFRTVDVLFFSFFSARYTATHSVQGKVCATLKKKTCENSLHMIRLYSLLMCVSFRFIFIYLFQMIYLSLLAHTKYPLSALSPDLLHW